ncbi:uncharacterized protein DUF4355 [Natranaerovirga pectinivora]|uniref:Uncharacterized protein DUF4355 n=1 Tax=Natranaerovirga pectinivora TaxID=682400 RepID=A0A4V2V0J6_9FIRM|nr:DUF4355 domain-containing protein [Natranaerovirga pectinivora]TCT16397.1 uncharacterized protein DUF4355 [Natranaerovirga pectinivora]
MELNLEQVQEFIETNKDNEEVKSYIGGFITSDGVESFLDNEEGKKVLQPKLDKHFSKGLETWKANNLEKLLDEEIKKRFPEADPKDVELQKLQVEIEKMKQEKQRETITNKAIKIANEKKIPLDMVDFLIGSDEESTIVNIEKLESILDGYIQEEVKKRIGKDTYTPPASGSEKALTLEQIESMSQEEINKNWEAVQRVLQNK